MRKKKATTKETIPKEVQEFVNIRKRPAVFLFLAQSMSIRHVVDLRDLLRNQFFTQLDVVINSGGGDMNAAFQMVQLLRMHTKSLKACVPFLAKSAATLICLGADTIVLDELAQLGPLDTQIYEEKKAGKGEFVSALNPFKTLEQLQKYSIETLDIAVKMVISRSDLDLDECIKHAINFVRVTTGPLFSKLDPEKLGEYTRALSVGTEYGNRLLRRYKNWDDEKVNEVLERLVHGYPSHDYIIDYIELKEIGLDAELFNEEEEQCCRKLFPLILKDTDFISLVVPQNENNKGQEHEKDTNK
jgi:hypothetical protein